MSRLATLPLVLVGVLLDLAAGVYFAAFRVLDWIRG